MRIKKEVEKESKQKKKLTPSEISEETRRKQFNEDLRFIRGELIAQQKDGNYCKFSRVLKCVIVENMTREQHTNYWINTCRLRKYSDEQTKQILDEVNNKLDNDLISLDTVIKAEKLSKDTDKEKARIIKEITMTSEERNSKKSNSYYKKK